MYQKLIRYVTLSGAFVAKRRVSPGKSEILRILEELQDAQNDMPAKTVETTLRCNIIHAAEMEDVRLLLSK